jgi:hypothetical protein
METKPAGYLLLIGLCSIISLSGKMVQSFFCEEMAQNGSSSGYGPGATEVTALEDGSRLLVNGRIKC